MAFTFAGVSVSSICGRLTSFGISNGSAITLLHDSFAGKKLDATITKNAELGQVM